jgi:hypothetical protein
MAQRLPGAWIGAMKATIFTGWAYDYLKPYAVELEVAHPAMLKGITAAKMEEKFSGLLMPATVKDGSPARGALMSFLSEYLCVKELLRLSRASYEMFSFVEKKPIETLRGNSLTRDRAQRLMTIQGVGEIAALTWALEIGDLERFSSIGQAESY